MRNYISYSSFNTLLKSKKQFIDTYVHGKKIKSVYLDFGKKIADALSDRNKYKTTANTLENFTLFKLVPEIPEFSELEIDIKLSEDQHPLVIKGFLDGFNLNATFDLNAKTIIEYKTSKNERTQSMVDKEQQLTFYTMLISKKFRIRPEEIDIKLVELKTGFDKDNNLFLMGTKQEFMTKRSSKDVNILLPKIKVAWQEMLHIYKSFYLI